MSPPMYQTNPISIASNLNGDARGFKLPPFRRAVRAARASLHYRYHVGAVVAKGNRIVSVGINQQKTHTKSPSRYKTIHAETHALLRAGAGARGGTIYVARILADGSLGISRPCLDCQALLDAAGIRKMVYVDRDGKICVD